MIVTITDGAFYVATGLLTIAFFPHLYLFLIFAMMGIVELIESIKNLIHKFIKLTIEYIFPLAIILLFYLALVRIFNMALMSLSDGIKHVY